MAANAFALFNHPTTELIDPYEATRRKLAIANALAAQQIQAQQIQQGQMGLEQAQRDQAAEAAFRAQFMAPQAAAPAAAVPPGVAPVVPAAAGMVPAAPLGAAPGGAPPPAMMRTPAGAAPAEIPDSALYAAFGSKAPGLIKARDEAASAVATRNQKLGEVREQDQKYWGALAGGWEHADYDPRMIPGLLQLAAGHGLQNTPEFAQFSQLAQSGDIDGLKRLAGLAITPEIRKTISEGGAADALATGRKTDNTQNLIKNAGAFLKTVPNKGAWDSYLSALQKKDPEAAAAFADIAWGPNAPAIAQQRALSGAEQITTAETAKRDTATEKYQRGELAARQAEVGISREKLNVDKAAADPWGTLGLNPRAMGGGAAGGNVHGEDFLATLPPQFAATVKATAEGRQTNLPRGGRELDLLMGAVNQYDPTYSVQRGQMRTAFSTGVQGRNIGNLNTAVAHLDQLHEVVKAMNNGSFKPGNALYNRVADAFGSARASNPKFVIQSFAGEAANALKGSATDPEIAHILGAIDPNQGPEQLEGTTHEGLKVLGQKLNTYDEQFQQNSPGDPWSPVLPSARRVFNRYKIQPLARISQAPEDSGTAPAAHAAPVVNGKPLADHSTDELFNLLVKK